MLLNYLKLSLRLLVRNPFFTFINVLGLSVGFASFFMLWQHASSELKTDQFHKDHEKIGRIGMAFSFPEDSVTRGHVTFGSVRTYHAPMLSTDFPQIDAFTRIMHQPTFSNGLVGHDREVVISMNRENGTKDFFKEDHMAYVDPNLFEFFNIPLVHGAKENVLRNANSVALSQATARRYFGNQNPIGEILTVNNTILLTVTGVFQDMPHNTHLVFDMVVSNVGVELTWRDHRYYPMATSYIKLKDESQMGDFQSAIQKHKKKYFAPDLQVRPFADFDFFFQPLKDIAFSTPYERDHLQPKSKSTLIFLQIASVLILLMAWINYINLSISKSLKRMKEVATRKMSGALWRDFLKQFLVESTLVHLLALALALTMIQLVRFPAQLFLGIHAPPIGSVRPLTWWTFTLVIIGGAFITGLYPTLMSVSHNPRSLFILSARGPKRRWVQSLMTTGQYAAALALILWAFIVYLQLNFILNKDLGIDRQQVIVIDAPTIRSGSYLTDFETFMNGVRSTSGVQEATFSLFVNGDYYGSRIFGLESMQNHFFFQTVYDGGVDDSFIPFYKIKLIAGRNFLSNDKADIMIVSRHTTKRLGYKYPEDAVDENVLVEGWKVMQIIGVIEDYRFRHLINLNGTASEAVTGPGICLTYKYGQFNNDLPQRISLRLDMDRVDEILTTIRNRYTHTFAGNAFNWYFLDEHSNEAYQNEKVNRNQIILFTVLAIGISCLGLLGMVTVLAEEKTKEIGIRKVLGAGIKDVGKELLSGFFWQIAIAAAVGLPIAYFVSNQYLQHYLERISLHWWHFTLPVAILLVIMISSIASVLWKAARSNPVEALKYE